MIIAPAESTILGIAGPLVHGALLIFALLAFAFILWRRSIPLRLAAPDPRLDQIGHRLVKTLIFGFGQARQPRYKVAGILHILIFAGFLILSIRSLTLLGQGFASDFMLPGLSGVSGDLYSTLKDYTGLVVLLACVVAGLRRLLFRPVRYHDRHAIRSHGHEAYLILGLISMLMVADAFHEGSSMAPAAAVTFAHPMASVAASALTGMEPNLLSSVHLWSFWIHNLVLLFFLCYLPVSKHFHVITALPNVFLLNLKTPGAVKPPRYDTNDLDQLDQLGVGQFEDFTWKHVLDFYSCTDCGRCSDHCPAYATGTPLSPRMISIKSRDLAYEKYPILGKPPANGQSLVGDLITEGELWACTTCGACEEACPVFIEYVDKIVDMRRFLVEEGRVPTSLQKPLEDLEKRGNPYGKMARQRDAWTRTDGSAEPVVRTLEKGGETKSLFFTDSCAAYDPRIQQVTYAMGKLLRIADEDCATLGKDEVDSGHEVRRFGEEGLFESLRDQNLEAMEERTYDRVITTDPHAFNALRNDGYDLDQPVLHHSQVLAELIENGKLTFTGTADHRTYAFHDPCYLGRHNGEYDAPRKVLEALPGLKTVEMERSRNRSFCCGGGSLYLFHEGEAESRMGEKRLEMAESAGADVVVTACPFCTINLEDAVKTTGREGQMEIVDLAELVARFVDEE
jgi:Fe-S oxidoreductase